MSVPCMGAVFLYCSVVVSVSMEKLSEDLIVTVIIMFLLLLPVDGRFMREAEIAPVCLT